MSEETRGDASDCGCGSLFRDPKANGTCATCGGWLPGERLRYRCHGDHLWFETCERCAPAPTPTEERKSNG